MQPIELHSARLRLRAWRDDDLPAFVALNADAEVMRHFPGVMSEAESRALAERIRGHFAAHGFGQWVLERHDQPGLIGVLGLQHVSFAASFTPAVEIGWRLHSAFWRQGYALEAAQTVLHCGYTQLGVDEVVAFTVRDNLPSQRLMQRLSMRRDAAGDFEHPHLPPDHPLRPHVLYRLSWQDWLVATVE